MPLLRVDIERGVGKFFKRLVASGIRSNFKLPLFIGAYILTPFLESLGAVSSAGALSEHHLLSSGSIQLYIACIDQERRRRRRRELIDRCY